MFAVEIIPQKIVPQISLQPIDMFAMAIPLQSHRNICFEDLLSAVS
jgi:hypothetical protein